MQTRTFDATHTAVAFPLGGIGTGNVSLGARGNFRDWEIFNEPAKGNALPNTFFALRTQIAGQEPVVRVLEGPLQPPFDASHGFHPATNAGLPRCAGTTFRGEYPFAWIDFADDRLPVEVSLEAYTPLIPLNPDNSGIPCAILSYHICNSSAEPVALTLVGSLCNPVGGLHMDSFMNLGPSAGGQTRNEYRDSGPMRGLFLSAEGVEPDDLRYGSMSLVTDHEAVTVKVTWLRGAWWDFLQDFWDDFVEDGRLENIDYELPAPGSRPDSGSLGLLDTLNAGEERTYRFILSWHFPNRRNTWTQPNQENAISQRQSTPDGQRSPVIRNHYATRFEDAWAVAAYVIENGTRLDGETRKFHNALFGSTLPPQVLDAVSANIVPLRSNTCFWLEDGRFYGWEGCFNHAGCCAGTCTHVWSYAYTLAFLFPSLEREMRRIEFEIETELDGFMNFRNFKSMGEAFIWAGGDQRAEAAVDGQMGSILRAYREWQLSGDRAWLEALWPGIKRAIDFASGQWDRDQDGVLDGKQHNTYDIEFYGPNPLCSIYYLAALRAVERMAGLMGEAELARRCHALSEKASVRLDALLWNGDYFIQQIDDVDAHKYQHGLGCLSDQLLGQLHAQMLDLGDLLPREHLQRAIKAIYDYNFRESFREQSNCQRTYILGDEFGLLMCSWPKGGRPKLPFPYSDEVWTGVEYQVAAHLIAEGWVEQGLRLVWAVRERHDGRRRNPWDEVECGHHYARSMSSWMLLLALSGFHGDLGQGTMRFAPVMAASTESDRFACFWCNGRAWGVLRQSRDSADGSWNAELEVLGGSIEGLDIRLYGSPLE